MIVGGAVELMCGVRAERRRLEGIARPLTAVGSAVRTGAQKAGSAAAGARARRQRSPSPGTSQRKD